MIDPFSKLFQDHIFQVNFDFYDLVYKDEWFKDVFRNVTQEVITRQQTDFIVQAFGGPANYCGRMPGDAHPHIYIDEHMWNLREIYLNQAFTKNNTDIEIRNKWLKIDNSFKNTIVKSNLNECKKRFYTDEIIFIDSSLDPRYKKA